MARNLFILPIFFLLLGLALPAAAGEILSSTETMLCNADRFDAYSVAEEKNLPAKEIDFSSYPEAKQYKTKIQDVYKHKNTRLNFGGHYTIATWGEGSPVCYHFAIVDNRDGKIVYYSPRDNKSDADGLTCGRPFFRFNSALIIFNAGCEASKGFWAGRLNSAYASSPLPSAYHFDGKKLNWKRLDYRQYGEVE